MVDAVPHVVYHAAAMGNWREVVREHAFLLRSCGLAGALAAAGDSVRVTHVGPDAAGVLAEFALQDVPVVLVRSDPNTDHYETFAMLEVERLAKSEGTARPVLYFHTKGVSTPHSRNKRDWRWVMSHHVVRCWRENLGYLRAGFDAVGFNFWFYRGENHFSGTYWLASAGWLRKLPDFVAFHHSKGLSRYSCELWIGSTQGIRAMSRGCNDTVTWVPDDFDYSPYLPGADVPDETITWVTAATPGYAGDLARLTESAALLGPGHTLTARLIEPPAGGWRHTAKLDALRETLPAVRTTHVFWVDADCQFRCRLSPRDLIDPARPLSAVRHFAYATPATDLPERFRHRLAEGAGGGPYLQACLFGGRVPDVAALLDRLRWMDLAREGYDEHGLNVEWANLGPGAVHVLPCRYAAPSNFSPMPAGYADSYRARAGGEARVLHHNREIGG